MPRWALDDIAWERFDAALADPELVRLAKAASLVEYNGAAYARHLCLVFADDPQFQEAVRRWGEEEVQHGAALARWAALADPGFDFAAAFARFQAGYHGEFDSGTSRRGSRSGEMIARCMVEIGTSSYYSALADAAREPVLQQICRKIAADEFRHYKLFYSTLKRYEARERLGLLRRLKVALGRIAETQDDELAYAWFAGNEPPDRHYVRRRHARAYARRAAALYRPQHVERAVAMTLKAVGLTANGRLAGAASRFAWRLVHRRAARPA